MVTHNASEQMLGYLYQVRYALYLLLKSEDPAYQIAIEKFDDISFAKDGEPKQLIQVKHHTEPASLTDSSTDLWRTINVWLDAIAVDVTLLDHTDFLIVTTATVPDNSVASYLMCGNHTAALERLLAIAEVSQNQSHLRYYEKFRCTDITVLRRFIRRIKIISSACDIVDVENEITKYIRFTCRPEHLQLATEGLEGWWFRECVKSLSSFLPVFTDQRQLQGKIYEITRRYDEDNLPVEFWNIDEVNDKILDPEERIFLEQLKLLNFRSRSLRLAIQDYYRATQQRSSWLRQGLVFTNELDTYEHRLVDAWEHAFADMEEGLQDYGSPTENEKIKAGKQLYSDVMERDIRIRPRVEAAYIMKGTYHHLANSLTVGWHIDFFERLLCLLERK